VNPVPEVVKFKSYQELNLKIYRLIYGDFETDKLQKKLGPATPDFDLGKNWDLPKFKDFPPPRILILCGVGSLWFLKKVAEDPFVKANVHRFIIIENDVEIMTHIMSHQWTVNLLQKNNWKFLFFQTVESIKPLFFNILKDPGFSRVMENAQLFVNTVPPHDPHRGFYEQLKTAFEETMRHVYHNFGQIGDSLLGLEATLKNKKFLLEEPGILDLKNCYKDKPAFLIGAGPTLDEDLDKLKAIQDKVVIVAADAAVKPLTKAGIVPDYATSIERGNVYQKPFWEDLPRLRTELVAFPVVHPEVLDLYPGPIRIVYRNYSYYAYFEKGWPKGLLHSGGSTCHLGLRLIDYMGCDPIYFLGIDNSYQKVKGDLYRSHCKNTGYPEWSEGLTLKEFRKKRNHAPIFEGKTYSGETVMTNITYSQWAKEFGEESLMLNLPGRAFCASEQALTMPGISYRSMADITKSLAPFPPKQLALRPTHPTSYRSWTHKELIKSNDGWLRDATLGLSFCEQAKKVKQDIRIVSFIYQFYMHRLIGDDLFVSFVLQNCAKEYYGLENIWFSFKTRALDDYDKRIQNLYNKFLLIQIVTQKMKGLFDDNL